MRSHDVEAESEDLTPVATPRAAGLRAALAGGGPGEDPPEPGADGDLEAGAPDLPGRRGRRWTNTVVGVAALFSVAASAAVLIALWRGHSKGGGAGASDGPQAGAVAQQAGTAQAAPKATGGDEGPGGPPAASGGVDPAGSPAAATGGAGARTAGAGAPTGDDSAAQAAGAHPPTADDSAASGPPPKTRRSAPPHLHASSSTPARADHPSSAHSSKRAGHGAAATADTPDHATGPSDSDGQAQAGASASGSSAAGSSAAGSDQGLPLEPSDAQIQEAFDAPALSKELSDCASHNGVTGTVQMRMKINPDGSVAWAAARLDNRAFQACLDHLFHKTRMPASYNGRALRHDLHF